MNDPYQVLGVSRNATDEEIKKELDRKLQKIKEKIKFKPQIRITYFIPDLRKDGGKYTTFEGIVNKIDEYNQTIIFQNKKQIKILDIIDIEECQ